jgi:hypothetical protein
VSEARPRTERELLLATAAACAAALIVAGAYLVHARVLLDYPWDWSPDEGLYLDYGRRALEAPGTLYSRRVVPFPSAYGPLVPASMALVARLPDPLRAGRLLALAWMALAAAALATLVHRRSGPAWAAAGVALYLAPFDLSFWHALVRVDGPMTALWLWSAVPLLPRTLERGGDVLSSRRIAAGTALLISAVLFKPTAALHGTPLVLAWFLVDSRSAWRLAAAMCATGGVVLGVLQVATGGGFLWVNGLWGLHPSVAGLPWAIVARFAGRAWAGLLIGAASCLAAAAARHRPHREPAIVLLAGGVAIAPLLGKQGASWNYLLPLYAAALVAAAGWAARSRSWAAPAAAVLAVVLAATSTFPLPTALDEATARAFYGFTQRVQGLTGGPLLVSRPELVYFLAGQPAEIEGSSFVHLANRGAPGTEDVLRRLEEGRYALVVSTWPLPVATRWTAALQHGYRRVGQCRLGWYYGDGPPSYLLVRRDLSVTFAPPAGTRCVAGDPVPWLALGRSQSPQSTSPIGSPS